MTQRLERRPAFLAVPARRGSIVPLVFLAGWALLASPASAQEPLFDGVSLAGWAVTEFSAPVQVRDSAIVLTAGEPMTGIVWQGDFPPVDYEVTFQAKRLSGSDFFAAVTFPVKDDPCTLVVGGWGGRVVGLSSLEGADASENETRRERAFEKDRWYDIRLRVTGAKIEAWIDDEQMVDLVHTGRLLSVRVEVLDNVPFGISTWQTTGALRNLQLRRLP